MPPENILRFLLPAPRRLNRPARTIGDWCLIHWLWTSMCLGIPPPYRVAVMVNTALSTRGCPPVVRKPDGLLGFTACGPPAHLDVIDVPIVTAAIEKTKCCMYLRKLLPCRNKSIQHPLFCWRITFQSEPGTGYFNAHQGGKITCVVPHKPMP